MNIFYVAECPVEAAQALVDKHVVKMVLETAQLLSTAHRVLDGREIIGTSPSGRKQKQWQLYDARENFLYKATHINHPSAVWARSSIMNYSWLADHLFALLEEYTYRYDKRHKVLGELSYMLNSPPKNLEEFDFTEPPCCMDEKYIISENVVDNYRNYYILGKSDLHCWKRRDPPNWIYEPV